MSEVKITTKEAETKIRMLIQAFLDLKNATEKVGDSGAKSNQRIAKDVEKLAQQIVRGTELIEKYKQALANMAQAQKQTQSSLSGAVKVAKDMWKEVQRLDQKLVKATKALLNMTNANNQNKSSLKVATKEIRAMWKEILSLDNQLIKANKALDAANAKLKNVRKSGSGGVFSGLTSSVRNLASAFGLFIGVNLFADAVKSAFSLARRLDSLRFSMKAVITDTRELAQTQEFLKKITNDFGAEIVTATNRFIKFKAAAQQAGFSVAATQDIFGTMTKAAGVLGLRTDELQGIFLALEQMISKGKITTEELRRQLGERLPGAMDIMANSMGVTTAVLDEMLKKGEVMTKDVLPGFAREVEKAFGLNSVQRVDTLQAATVRLQNAWTQLVSDTSQAGGATTTITRIMDGLAENLGTIVKLISFVIAGWLIYKTVLLGNTIITAIHTKALNVQSFAYRRLIIAKRAKSVADVAETGTQNILTASYVVAKNAIRGLIFQIKLLWATMIANPITAIVAGLALLITAHISLSDAIEESTEEIQRQSKETTGAIQNTAKLNQETRVLYNRYKELLPLAKGNAKVTKELNEIIVLLGKNIPAAADGINSLGQATKLNTPILEEFIKGLSELNNLKAKAVIRVETGNLAKAKKELIEFNKLKQGIVLPGVDVFSLEIDGIGKVAKVRGKYMKDTATGYEDLTAAEIDLFIAKEASIKTEIETAKELLKINKELLKIEDEDPSGELREEQNQKELAFQEKIAAEEKRRHEQTKGYYEDQISLLEKEKDAVSNIITIQPGETRTTAELEVLQTGMNVSDIAELNKKIANYKALIEELDPSEKKGNKTRELTLKQLRELGDLYREIENITLKKKVLELEVVAADPKEDFKKRERAIQESFDLQNKIAVNEYNIQLDLLKRQTQAEIDKSREEIALAKTTSERKIELEIQINDLRTELGQKNTIEEKKFAIESWQIAKKLYDDKKALEDEKFERKLKVEVESPFLAQAIAAKKAYDEQIAAQNFALKAARAEYDASKKTVKDKIILEEALTDAKINQTEIQKKLAEDLAEIEIEQEKAVIQIKIKRLLLEALNVNTQKDRREEIRENIKELQKELSNIKIEPADEEESPLEKFKRQFTEILDAAKQFKDAMQDLGNALFDSRIENINAEIKAREEFFDRQIELEEGNALQQELLQRAKEAVTEKLEKKRLKEEQKKAKFNKASALADIAINTAVAITATLKETGFFGIPLTFIVAALGALQAAAVLAAPIPKYKEGGEIKKDHFGMINDGSNQEFIRRGDNILTTKAKNVVVPLQAGDTIYKSYDDLSKKTFMMTGLYSGAQIPQNEFEQLFEIIPGAIMKGFSKAKLNNNINIKGFNDSNARYRDSLTNWKN